MEFTFIETVKDGGDHWISDCGEYKINLYHHNDPSSLARPDKHYSAYRPHHYNEGKPVFGNFVPNGMNLRTLTQAKKACIEYHKRKSQ